MSATTLATTLTSGIMWDYRADTGTVASGLIAVDSNRLSQTQRLANAAADLVWHDHATLTVGTASIDLFGIPDTFGNTISMGHVMGIFIKNLNTVAGDVLRVGGAGATAFFTWTNANSTYVIIGPGGCFLMWYPDPGYTCAGGADILKLEAVGHDITYDIVVVGKT